MADLIDRQDVPDTNVGDMISRQAFMKAMYHRAFETDGDTMWQSGCWVRYRAIEQVVKEQPSADVQPVRHGHWIIPRFGADARCSVCGYYFNDAYDMENEDNYCRHCGALMDGDRNDIR